MLTPSRGPVTSVRWSAEDGSTGSVACQHVVNCAGMLGREVGGMLGTDVPLMMACEDFYIVSEPIAGLDTLPVLRVPDDCAYYKEDAGKRMLVAFGPRAKP